MLLLPISVVRALKRYARVVLLGGVALLAGCYPEYNWREIPMADGMVVAAFPARVNPQARTLELAGVEVEFHVNSARLDNSIFALGYARLPTGTSLAEKRAVIDAMTDSLFRSLGQTVDESAREGQPFVIRSQQGGVPLLVVGRVLAHRDLVLRLMASGPVDELPEAIGIEFIESLSLR